MSDVICGNRSFTKSSSAVIRCAVVLVEYYAKHYFASRGGTDDYSAHQPCVFANIVERIAVIDAETFYLVADFVRRVALQPAFANVENLVEHVRNMESECGSGSDFAALRNLVIRQPTAVGEREFEFIAVEQLLLRTQTRTDFGQLHLTYTRKLVAYLLGLVTQLLFVRQVLPFAAAAHAEVFAHGFGAHRRTLHVVHHRTLHEAAVFGAYLHIHDIARNRHRDEYHRTLVATNRFTLGGERSYFKPLDKGIRLTFSCHYK